MLINKMEIKVIKALPVLLAVFVSAGCQSTSAPINNLNSGLPYNHSNTLNNVLKIEQRAIKQKSLPLSEQPAYCNPTGNFKLSFDNDNVEVLSEEILLLEVAAKKSHCTAGINSECYVVREVVVDELHQTVNQGDWQLLKQNIQGYNLPRNIPTDVARNLSNNNNLHKDYVEYIEFDKSIDSQILKVKKQVVQESGVKGKQLRFLLLNMVSR